MAGGYFYCYRSFESYVLAKKELEEEGIKLEAAEARLKKLEGGLKSDKVKNSMEEAGAENDLAYFGNISEFKEKVDSFLRNKEMDIISIAAQEKEEERIYLAYSLRGSEEKFFEFLEGLETQHDALTLLNSPIRMTDKNLEIKIGGYFKGDEFSQEHINVSREENLFSKRDFKMEYYPLGMERGIVILTKEGEYPKRIFLKGEAEIEYRGEVYRLKAEKGGVKIQ